MGDGGSEDASHGATSTEGARPTVLLVDDEPDLVDVYALWLEDDYEVLTAYSGEEALRLVDRADIVLLDRKMPELRGEHLLDRLGAEGSEVRAGFVSALPPDDQVEGLAHDAYVQKPVTREELLAVVERLADDLPDG